MINVRGVKGGVGSGGVEMGLVSQRHARKRDGARWRLSPHSPISLIQYSRLNVTPHCILYLSYTFTAATLPCLKSSYNVRHENNRIRHARLKRRVRIQDPALRRVHRRDDQEGAGPSMYLASAVPLEVQALTHEIAGFRENTQNRVDLPTIKYACSAISPHRLAFCPEIKYQGD
jgi:hypothetical protein